MPVYHQTLMWTVSLCAVIQIPGENGFQEAKLFPWRFSVIICWQPSICLALSLNITSLQWIMFLFFPHKIPLCKPNSWVIICCGCRDAGSQPAHQHSSLHQRINLLPEVDFLSLGYWVYSNSQSYKCHYFISIPLYLICQLSFLYSSSY